LDAPARSAHVSAFLAAVRLRFFFFVLFADEEGEDFAEEFFPFFDLARREFAEVLAGEALEVRVDEVVEDVFFSAGSGRGCARGL
jgi:hypothetical protein